MKTIKAIIVIILCIICVSCLTQKNVRVPKKIYQIGYVKMTQIDMKKLAEVLPTKGKKMFYMGSPNNPTVFYTSKDYEVIAARVNRTNAFSTPLSQRFKNMMGLSIDNGNTVLSYDSISIGQNWIYAYMFINKIKNSELDKIGIRIETNNTEIFIRTDIQHKETAIGLMDAFTMELMNVKLNLKPYKK